ncbi:MAG: hypothetical protein ACLS9F_18495 [Clostridium paraputrificum]
MNIYDSFFLGMDANEWELFAEDFFRCLGGDILDSPAIGTDGGKDLKVQLNDKKYIVSCKHFIESGKSVGLSDEPSISDRVIQHDVDGFIGFYSTQISTGLKERFDTINNNPKYNCECIYYDKSSISNFIPYIDFRTLQKYGICNGLSYVLNVPKEEYKPLECVSCKKDILSNSNINSSIVAIYENGDKLSYLYGCKSCLPMNEIAYAEISQVLHLEQLNGWNSFVDEILSGNDVDNDFYKNKNYFDNRILQKIYPQNLGTWI